MTLREDLEALEGRYREAELAGKSEMFDAMLALCRRAVDAERDLRDRYDARRLYLEAAQRDKERMNAEIARLRAENEKAKEMVREFTIAAVEHFDEGYIVMQIPRVVMNEARAFLDGTAKEASDG